LALGLVLASGRPLLLLDEPAAALDREGKQRVLELLERVPPTAAVVIASHDPDFLDAAGCWQVALSARG
jgi:ATP-binding cassette subfamily C protein CydD